MTCSKNLCKHFKIVTKLEPIGKYSNMICKNLMTFFSKLKSGQILPFHIYFSHLCKVSNQKRKKKRKLVMICVFECFQSHCHKRITWIFVYDGCHNHFWEKLVSDLDLWIMDRWQSQPSAHMRRWQRKQNVKRWMWIFNNQIRINHLT
jgi:hypothetical protein